MDENSLLSRIRRALSRAFRPLRDRVLAWWAAATPAAHQLRVKAVDKLRAAPLLVVFLIAFSITAWMAPVKVGLTIWGIAKLGMGGYVGYWVDRILFPYARPHEQSGIAQGTAWKRRALIVSASIVAAALTP